MVRMFGLSLVKSFCAWWVAGAPNRYFAHHPADPLGALDPGLKAGRPDQPVKSTPASQLKFCLVGSSSWCFGLATVHATWCAQLEHCEVWLPSISTRSVLKAGACKFEPARKCEAAVMQDDGSRIGKYWLGVGSLAVNLYRSSDTFPEEYLKLRNEAPQRSLPTKEARVHRALCSVSVVTLLQRYHSSPSMPKARDYVLQPGPSNR